MIIILPAVGAAVGGSFAFVCSLLASIFDFLTAFLSNVGVIDLGRDWFKGLLELTNLNESNFEV